MLKAVLDTYLNTFHLEVSLAGEVGKTTVLLGESGAGKSTVLRLLAGLLHPQRGHISLDGVTYFDSEQRILVPAQERPFGYVFQDYVLFPHLNVFENVAFGLRAQHLPRRMIQQRVGETLERVHLVGFDQHRPAQLSGGQQQRVAIARALALQPKLLLLDEPLAALDVQTRREVRQELRRILTDVGVTTVLVTHQYLEALLFGHTILVLDDGQVIQQGSRRDLLEHPRSAYVAELVGMNFFRGRVVRCEANALCTIRLLDNGGSQMGDQDGSARVPSGDHKGLISTQHRHRPYISLPLLRGEGIEVMAVLEEQVQAKKEVPEVGMEAYVVVDPRSITLYQTAPDSSARNVFCGEIVQTLPLGSSGKNGELSDGRLRVSIMVDAATAPLMAEITEGSAVRMGLGEGKIVYAAFKATEARAYT